LKTFEGLIKIQTPDLFGWESQQIHKFASIDLPILKKKVSQILTITLVRISKRLKKENHEIKIPEDRKLKKTRQSFMNK